MKGDSDRNALKREGAAAQPRNRLIQVEEAVGGGAPDAEDEVRPEDFNLSAEVADAGVALGLGRLAIVRWAALDDVSDIAVGLARESNCGEHLVEEIAGSSHKGQSLAVFFRAGAFSDHEHLGICDPLAEDRPRAGLGENAGAALAHPRFEGIEARLPIFGLTIFARQDGSPTRTGRAVEGRAVADLQSPATPKAVAEKIFN